MNEATFVVGYSSKVHEHSSTSVCVCVCVCVSPLPGQPAHLGLPVYATPAATVLVDTGDRRRREDPLVPAPAPAPAPLL